MKTTYKLITLCLLALIFSVFFANPAFSQKTDVKGVYTYKLSNGLELYVCENSCAPLVYIEIAVKGGAVTQTPETAGLFHLYEHMMFKGNDKYHDQKAFKKAMNALGTADWNGTTSVDRVNYFFTIPSSLVKEGLDFWSHAVRNPLMDEKEFENEKLVVLSEINGNFTDPQRIYYASLCKALYKDAPWTLDSGGSPDAVKNATVSDLKEIQGMYYVPENSALFVGGDVKHDEVYKYVKEIFGDWKNPSKKRDELVITTKTPYTEDVKYVYPNPSVSPNYVQVEYFLRGPDGETDESDTYAADVWGTLIQSPDCEAVQTLLNDEDLCVPEPNYVYAYYGTQRTSGRIAFSATMLNEGKLNPVQKAEHYGDVLKNRIIKPMAERKDYYSQKDIDETSRRMEDERLYSLETPRGYLGGFSYMWAACSGEYFLNYEKNMSQVKSEDITEWINKYVHEKKGVMMVSVNPDVYEKYKADFDKNGYSTVTQDNAFWWR